MSQNLTYKSKEDLEFDEELERILDKFIIKLICALIMDFIGLLLMFLILDFSFSSYIFGFSFLNYVFAYFQLENIGYPLRPIIGTFGMILAIISLNILGSIVAGIKNKRNPLLYLQGAFNRYLGKIKEAKFKRK